MFHLYCSASFVERISLERTPQIRPMNKTQIPFKHKTYNCHSLVQTSKASSQESTKQLIRKQSLHNIQYSYLTHTNLHTSIELFFTATFIIRACNGSLLKVVLFFIQIFLLSLSGKWREKKTIIKWWKNRSKYCDWNCTWQTTEKPSMNGVVVYPYLFIYRYFSSY